MSEESMKTTKREQAVEYARYLILPLCSKPELIAIEDVLDERGLMLNLKVHREDMGLLIGRDGSVINSIRRILHIWGARKVASVHIRVEEIQ